MRRLPETRYICLERKGPGMRYRPLGSTGIEVSVIGLGTWQLGGESFYGQAGRGRRGLHRR